MCCSRVACKSCVELASIHHLVAELYCMLMELHPSIHSILVVNNRWHQVALADLVIMLHPLNLYFINQ